MSVDRLSPQRETEFAAAVAELDADRTLSFGTWTAGPVTGKSVLPPEQAFAVEDVARIGGATLRGSVGVFGDERHAAFTALARTAVPDLLAELAAVRKERDEARESLDFLERNTLPDLRRQIQHHQDGKKRWRDRAEKAEGERDALQERLHRAALAKVWVNEDGKKFVFVEDIGGPLFGIESKVTVESDVEFGVAAVQPGEDFETFFVCDSRAAAEQQIAEYGDVYRSCRLVQRNGRHGAWTEATS